MLLQFSLDESYLLASAPELFVRALCCLLVVAFPFLAVRAVLIMLELDGKSSSLEAEKKVRLHTPWHQGRQKHSFFCLREREAETLLFGVAVVMTSTLSGM